MSGIHRWKARALSEYLRAKVLNIADNSAASKKLRCRCHCFANINYKAVLLASCLGL